MSTRAKVRETARAQATRSGRVPQSAIDAELKAFDDKDLRLRSVAPNVRQREAKRRLTDIEVAAGQPGTNLCRFTGMASSEKQRGKRPYFYKEKTVGRAGVDLCKKAVEDAWNDPAFLAEQRRVCGDDKEYVFPYKRKSGTVKGHCRNLHAPHPRARKAKPDPRLKQLEKLIAKRDKTNDMALNAKLSAEIRALRAEIREPIQSEPDDISAYDFTSVRPTPTPPTDDPPPVSDTVDDAEAPATVPPPDDTDDPFVNPFTGVPGTGFDGTATPAPKPAFNQRIYAYIDSLPRGEKRKATDTLRQYVYGPGNMQPDDALQRYKERRVRDAQAPVGSTDFDDLAASDSDAEESDDDILGAGATTSKPALPEALSRTDSDRELASLQDEHRMASLAANHGLKNTLMIRKAIRDYPGATDPLFTGALGEFRQRTDRELAYDRNMGATGLSVREGTPAWAVYKDIDQRYRDAHRNRVASLDADIDSVNAERAQMRDDARVNMGLRVAGLSGFGADSRDDLDYDQVLAGAGLTVY